MAQNERSTGKVWLPLSIFLATHHPTNGASDIGPTTPPLAANRHKTTPVQSSSVFTLPELFLRKPLPTLCLLRPSLLFVCALPLLWNLKPAGMSDVGSSMVAEKIVSLCRGYARSLIVELGICLEGRWVNREVKYLASLTFHTLSLKQGIEKLPR